MAFKKKSAGIDFSKLDPNYRAAPESPYAMTDRFHFHDKSRAPRKIHRGTVDIQFDEPSHSPLADTMLGDVAYRATTERDGTTQHITLVFKGQRARDLKDGRVMADFQARHEERCDANDFDTPLTATIIVEGTWVPRNWKDAQGNWHKRWEMLVAQWHYQPQGEQGFVIEGALPEFEATADA